jgi:hypothetical protein
VNISCADGLNVSNEEYFHNMTSSQTDNIHHTFNYTSHYGFWIGTTYINNNSCNSTATYVLDVPQTMNGAQDFQELLLQDSGDNVIFTTIISTANGYDNSTYDFQMLVPESAIKATPTTYYFFTQIGG